MSSVVFRCDGSPSVGMGHVVRCGALAQALLERSCPVRFVVHDLCTNAIDYLEKSGFKVSAISGSHDDQNPELAEYDLKKTVEIARQTGAIYVLIDHYGATGDYLSGLKNTGVGVGIIDDLADRNFFAVDWLLNQNLSAPTLPYRTRPDCVKLLGPAYALLRPQFSAARADFTRKFSTEDKHLLITLGGGDTARTCSWILKALNRVSRRLEIRCILGGDDPIPTRLTEAVETSSHDVRILRNVTRMAEQLVWADLAISAGGSTCWELCCLGLPMIVLIIADNQELIASSLGEHNYARNLGWWNPGISEPKLVEWVGGLLDDTHTRADMSARIWQLVDGQGAARAAESLIANVSGQVKTF